MDHTSYQQRTFAYQPCAEQRTPLAAGAAPAVHPVAVVGAGPVGLAVAIDLAQRGVPVVVLDDDGTLATGSRAICFAKRTLDILDRLGCGQRVAEKGVSWHVGRVFFGDAQVYSFDLLPEAGHRRPAFVNLQQYYLEGFLVDRAGQLAGIDLRWRHRVAGVVPGADDVALTVATPDGEYTLHARYVIAADGAHSTVGSSRVDLQACKLEYSIVSPK